jgi:hypothetical protein
LSRCPAIHFHTPALLPCLTVVDDASAGCTSKGVFKDPASSQPLQLTTPTARHVNVIPAQVRPAVTRQAFKPGRSANCSSAAANSTRMTFSICRKLQQDTYDGIDRGLRSKIHLNLIAASPKETILTRTCFHGCCFGELFLVLHLFPPPIELSCLTRLPISLNPHQSNQSGLPLKCAMTDSLIGRIDCCQI